MPALMPTDADVETFLAGVANLDRQADARAMCELMSGVTGEPAVLWGKSVIGFGSYHYRYESGREGDAPLAAFSPRAQQLVVYLAPEFEHHHADLIAQLGPHTSGTGCLYLKRLDDVDPVVLRQLVDRSVAVGRDVDRASRED